MPILSLRIQEISVSFFPSQGIATEINKTLMVCLKIGVMTINIKEKISGDFMIMECDVDSNLMTKMKMIMIRQ